MSGSRSQERLRFNDVRVQNRLLQTEIDAAVRAVIEDGRFELGREVYDFEAAFASYCGVRFALAVHSGTAALHLSLRALGLGPVDEVVTVANSDNATVAAICFAGARPVLVDIEPHSFNMDPAALAAAVTTRTRAVIPVHMYGRPAEMATILEVARQHHLVVVEDAAIATGALYCGAKTGSLGDAGCFSFAPGKVLGAFGWGGIVTTGDSEVARHVRMLRAYGEDPDRFPPPAAGFRFEGLHPDVMGWNLRMDTIQAAVLLVKLRHLESMIEERRNIAARYRSGLSGLPIVLPEEPLDKRHVYRNFVIRVSDRDAVRQKLYETGIPTGTHYVPPVHLQPAYQHLGYPRGALPETERAAEELLTLPIFPGMADAEVDLVVETLTRVLSA